MAHSAAVTLTQISRHGSGKAMGQWVASAWHDHLIADGHTSADHWIYAIMSINV
jgi:hypothetical protein